MKLKTDSWRKITRIDKHLWKTDQNKRREDSNDQNQEQEKIHWLDSVNI